MDVEITIKFTAEQHKVVTIPKVDYLTVSMAQDATMTVNGQEEDIPDILRLYLDEVAEQWTQIEAEAQAETILMGGV